MFVPTQPLSRNFFDIEVILFLYVHENPNKQGRTFQIGAFSSLTTIGVKCKAKSNLIGQKNNTNKTLLSSENPARLRGDFYFMCNSWYRPQGGNKSEKHTRLWVKGNNIIEVIFA